MTLTNFIYDRIIQGEEINKYMYEHPHALENYFRLWGIESRERNGNSFIFPNEDMVLFIKPSYYYKFSFYQGQIIIYEIKDKESIPQRYYDLRK